LSGTDDLAEVFRGVGDAKKKVRERARDCAFYVFKLMTRLTIPEDDERNL
jgi:hypothetical protein